MNSTSDCRLHTSSVLLFLSFCPFWAMELHIVKLFVMTVEYFHNIEIISKENAKVHGSLLSSVFLE